MEDIAARLSELLSSDEGLDNLKALAGSLIGGMDENPSESGGLSPADLGKIMKISKAISSSDDDRSRLLLALKPHLSQERQPRVDKAVKIMKLISVLPLISSEDIF